MNASSLLRGITLSLLVYLSLLGSAEKEPLMVLFNNATELLKKNKVDESIASYKALLVDYPQCPQAYLNMAIAYQDKKDFSTMRDMLNKAIQCDPAYAKAYFMLAELEAKENNKEQAAVHYRQGLFLKPDEASVHDALGRIYCEQSKFELSIQEYKEALKYDEKNPTYTMDLGNVLSMSQKNEEALECFLKLHELRPTDMNVFYNVAYCYKRLDRLDEAIAIYQELLEKKPAIANARYGLGTAMLARASCEDDWHQGWAGYEWRFEQSSIRRRTLENKTIWNGSALDGKILYLIAEQGLGDTFQCIRFARYAKEVCGACVVVSSQKPLVKLLSLCPYIDKVIELDKQPANLDAYAYIMSLPYILKVVEETIPAEVPYLYADPALVAHWEDELSTDKNFRIGLCWQGNPNYSTHFLRTAVATKSVTPSILAPLGEIPGVSFYSLQKDHASNVDDRIPDGFVVHIFDGDFDNSNGRFMDTAAVMKNLDLIITVDTSIAHLAGALGVPVWVMLPQPADWRWMQNRDDSPWYPTMRLFRQKKAGEWSDVVDEIYTALKALIADNK